MTPETKIKTTLACVASVIGAIVLATWTVRGYLAEKTQSERDMASEVSSLRIEIAALRNDVVSQRQFERFAANMRYENKEKGYNVIVPDPVQFAIR